jgi:hypothetical protein
LVARVLPAVFVQSQSTPPTLLTMPRNPTLPPPVIPSAVVFSWTVSVEEVALPKV